MSGYKRVNYYELCRLCTSSEGTKMHIFREEGRRRQLPTKIQVCLPLQVCEDDSLPKIICTHCADKLESFYDFRETCVNAENMLEGYFSALRYSEDFIREGKVYVKDEQQKKKFLNTDPKPLEPNQNHGQIKVATVTPVPVAQPVSIEALNAIHIVSQSDSETSFKDHINVEQPVSIDSAVIGSKFAYQSCNNTPETNDPNENHNSTAALIIGRTEGGTQTDFSDSKSVKDDSVQQLPITNSEENRTDSAIQQTEIALQQNQEMLVQFGFSKDKDPNAAAAALFKTEEAIQRSSIAQIGEFLRMKSVTLVETFTDSDGLSIAMCDTCGLELSSSEELTNHIVSCKPPSDVNTNGLDDKRLPISCEVCGKPFKRKEHLFQHRKLHTGERPYSCTTCSKAFSRKEHLVRHFVSHTGQKMHSCDICSKSFSRKDNLYKHRKTHGISGPFVCDVCGKSFVVRHYYQLHKATHSADATNDNLPFRCDICNKGFSVKHCLSMHRARHRNKTSVEVSAQPVSSEEQNNDSEGDSVSLSTVNASAILPPNVLHSGMTTSSNMQAPIFQVMSTASTAYLCAPSTVASTNQLLETYRRLHQTT